LKRDLYLPIPFVEALGRATIARAQLELSLDLIIAVLAVESARLRACRPSDPFQTKLDYLGATSRSRLLKHDWWRALRLLVSTAKSADHQYSDAAKASVYSRGGGFLEELMRPIAKQLDLNPPSLAMTPAKIEGVAEQFRQLALEACHLSGALVAAAKRLSILGQAALE
jgi:hypothetical protein